MKKKFLAILLAAIMVMTLLPTVAFAASEITEVNVTIAFNPTTGTAEITFPESPDYHIDGDVNLGAIKDGTVVYYYAEGSWRSLEGVPVETLSDDAFDFYIWQIHLYGNEGFDFDNKLASITVNGTEVGPTEGGFSKSGFEIVDHDTLGINFIQEKAASTPSGSTNIKGTITAADFAYEMIIPSDTLLTEDNHKDVLLGTDGKVSIGNIKHGANNIDISYTVDLSNGKLTDGTHDIATTYKYKQGEAEFAAIVDDDEEDATKVTVYTGGEVKDSFVNVTADSAQWDAAPVGDYNATVVFNFDSKEVVAETKTVADILNTVDGGFPELSMDPDAVSLTWLNGESESSVMTGMLLFMKDFANSDYVALDTELSADNGNYKCTSDAGATITFTMTENKLTAITVSGDNSALNGDYTARKSLTLAGALSSLGVLPTDYSTGIANFDPLEEHKDFKYYQEGSNLVIDNNDGTKKAFSLTDTVLIWNTSGVYVVKLDDGYTITVYTVGSTSDGALDCVLFSSLDLGFKININN